MTDRGREPLDPDSPELMAAWKPLGDMLRWAFASVDESPWREALTDLRRDLGPESSKRSLFAEDADGGALEVSDAESDSFDPGVAWDEQFPPHGDAADSHDGDWGDPGSGDLW